MLQSHPEVIDASRQALLDYGAGLSSVRFICGTQVIKQCSTLGAKTLYCNNEDIVWVEHELLCLHSDHT